MTAPRHPPPPSPTRAARAFEEIYEAEFDVVTSYFARRTSDPQTAADLTADTFVAAITSFSTFDRTRGTARGWVLGIARRVFAQHCEATTRGRDVVARIHGRRVLDTDEITDLVSRIDAEREGRELIAAMAALSPADREVIELVDLVGMAPKDAAKVLGMSSGALRIRLFRARGKVRDLASNGGQR
ncbi:RNA polymerase sigma-70 factor, ECF subfamily [Lentzea albidocapillata subsp. violacea]|uniref:RNA polymerase sigma-70 factor, ECF subfamily n=1 Tax=Lentzea albidocapillata subsp. violacea TaxID=128104 RepID=A0A1G9MN57_9PSEU|nr:RNA polymerase sigma factor [Lentzea albidocapillata]SDL75493.1 RNA polymerase sigma-70 factor, ECF subfamily [Lentzea albidocapillata subsp. violacea]